jgi:hypothetical protein
MPQISINQIKTQKGQGTTHFDFECLSNNQANPNEIISKQLRIDQFPAKQHALTKVPTQVGLKINTFRA